MYTIFLILIWALMGIIDSNLVLNELSSFTVQSSGVVLLSSSLYILLRWLDRMNGVFVFWLPFKNLKCVLFRVKLVFLKTRFESEAPES